MKGLTDMQRVTLRGIDRGDPPHVFDGRTLFSLYRAGLLDASSRITVDGRAALQRAPQPIRIEEEPSLPRLFPMPAPTTTERVATETDMSMLAVCCEPLEAAVGAGVLVGAGGRLFLRAGARAWFISFCPWCGEKRE